MGKGKGKGGFKYHRRDAEDYQKRASQRGYDKDPYISDDVPEFRPKEGTNAVRIIPPTWDDPKHYGIDLWLHYGIGSGNDIYLCPIKMEHGDECAICAEREKALKDDDEEYAKQLEAKKRVLAYVIDRDKEKEGIQVWAMPWTVDREINTLAYDKRSGEVYDVDDPEEGYDIEFKREGMRRNTKYEAIKIARRSSELDNDEALEFAEENPLPDMLIFYDNDHLEKALAGTKRRDEEEDDDDKKDRRRKRDKDDDDDDRKSKRRRDKDEDDEDDRKSSKRRSKDDDDDDDDDRRSKKKKLKKWEDLEEMDLEELLEYAEEADLDIDLDIDDEDKLRRVIAREAGIERPDREKKRDRDDDDDDDRARRMRRDRK